MEEPYSCPSPRPIKKEVGLISKVPRLLAWIGTAALLLLPIAYALRQQGKNSLVPDTVDGGTPAGPTPATDVTGQTAVCLATVPEVRKPGSATEYTATLSETHPTVALSCPEQTSVAPAKLKEGFVCPADTNAATLPSCTPPGSASKNGGEPIAAVGLSELIGGPATPAVTWKETVEESNEKKYELSLPASPLPLLDAQFTTGCVAGGKGVSVGSATCLVKVTVEARKSAATDQTVHCAYGANSNKSRPTVTLTPQNNKVTLVCGSKDHTEVQPRDYQTNYCADANVGTACKEEAYTTFIKDFKPEWWAKGDTNQSVTLTLPPENFPDTAKTIHLGCQYETKPKADGSKVDQPSVCVVDVVISAMPSSGTGMAVTVLPRLTLATIILTVSRVMWL